MFLFIPKTEKQDGLFLTDSIFLFLFVNLFKRFKNRRKKQ